MKKTIIMTQDELSGLIQKQNGWGQSFDKSRKDDGGAKEVKLSLREPFLEMMAEVVEMDIPKPEILKQFKDHMRDIRNTVKRLRQKKTRKKTMMISEL